MFFGRPKMPMAAPAPVGPGAAVPPQAPAAAPPIPPAEFVGPGPGMLNMDIGPGMLNMDIGGPYPAYPHMEYMEEGRMEAPRVHVVLKGDTIYKISRKYNVSMQSIIQANNLRYPDIIYPGQRLIIPDGLHYSNW